MNAVITVIGKDRVGILSNVSCCCTEVNANILDVNQTIMEGLFAMVMMVEVSNLNCDFLEFSEKPEKLQDKLGMKINIMHEDIFNSMHRI